MSLHEFDPPDRFVAGTVGPPGQRTFFLQASEGRRLTSVSLEKQQVDVLATRINDLLDSYAGGAGADHVAAEVVDNAPLDTPIEDEFRVNTLALAWDEDRQVIIIEALDRDPDDPEASLDPDVLTTEPRQVRVVLSPARARAFARRAQSIVAAGRPPCPFCGGPLEVEGHICPRANGYKR
ncbi:DUF3090 domain-containing protein [Pedococcus ginsenosidimutans]|jgi:uncharacterized repeat protein (TIGR03847 family)|uniref:DUF3090 domain-containing protein n=1 Tax=Pedococcus ginsenosidimutans TaxID=490570 RepID=A0ABP8YIY4_9MICO